MNYLDEHGLQNHYLFTALQIKIIGGSNRWFCVHVQVNFSFLTLVDKSTRINLLNFVWLICKGILGLK